MHLLRVTVSPAAFIFALFLVHAASAQVIDQMKATAADKMMPADRASKMRECEMQMRQQRIKMHDRSRFVDQCVWAKAK